MAVDDAVGDPDLVLARDAGAVRVLTLNRPERHNALVPELLAAARAELARAAADPQVRAVVLAGAGRSFSTGGDIAVFAAYKGEALRRYAREIVGALHALVIDLLALDLPVVAAVHGPVTGGSLGLVLASDLVVVSPEAWFAPYYVEVGFSPDGGWTVLLPERVGAGRALAWQLLNERVDAEAALAAGLATHAADDALARAVEIATDIAGKKAGAVARTKRLVRGDLDAVRAGLDAEMESFIEQIGTPETADGMRAFLS